MANTNSTVVTAHTTAQTAGRTPLGNFAGPLVLKCIRSRVTCPATPSTSDTLTLVPGELIPAGALYAPAESWVYPVTDPGTALTLDVGPTSNTDALADALALTTAGTTGGRVSFSASGTAPLALSSALQHVAGEDIVATVMVSTAVDATVIEFCIAYYSAE
jgi:hypothetical protein